MKKKEKGRECPVCKGDIIRSRPKYCSSACRQKAYRERKKSGKKTKT